jgi:hypothetical protein
MTSRRLLAAFVLRIARTAYRVAQKATTVTACALRIGTRSSGHRRIVYVSLRARPTPS